MGWARGNRYLYTLFLGDFEILDVYLDYLDANPKEILTAFVYIVKCANQYSYNINYVLDRFHNYLDKNRLVNYVLGTNNLHDLNFSYTHLFYELAKYRLSKNQIQQGIEHLITSFERSVSSNDDMMCIKCIDLYGKYRHFASKTQEEQYTKLIDKLSVPTFR
ncbi:helix-turn-helix domain-containing protein [Paenibacillus sp. FSL H7-689]|nr:helix-turn-helix domain-containing protein [Paenibacillus sp. FSL H7-689]